MRRRSTISQDDGTVIVMAAVCIVVVMGFAALAVDLGMVVTAEAELQNVADAAALAGVVHLATDDYWVAHTQARQFAAANTCLNEGNALDGLNLGYYDFDAKTFTPWQQTQWGTVPINAIKATAAREPGAPAGSLPLAFAGVLGLGSASVRAQSTAVVDSRVSGFDGSSAGIMLPFALSELAAGSPPVIGRVLNLYPNLPDEEDLVDARLIVPGNFGLLDLNDSNPGTSVLGDWIINGYQAPVEIPEDGFLSVPGDPGLRSALTSAVQQRVGDTVLVLVYNDVTGQGSVSTYSCTSLLAIEILSVTGNGMDIEISVRIEQMTSSGFIVRPGAPDNVSVCKMMLTM